MIKAVGEGDEGQLLLVGLSAEDSLRLHLGEVIEFQLHEMDERLPRLRIMLIAGSSDEEILFYLAPKMGGKLVFE